MEILVICGHGDGDPGACACGYKEATVVREFGPILRDSLSKYANVDLLDPSMNLYKHLKSGKAFNFKNYDYVIELHLNAGGNDPKGNGKTTGSEILVHTSEKGISVEEAILENIHTLGFRDRGVKRRSDLCNMNTCKKQGVSYALLEICFIDDFDDMKLYQSKKHEIASAITHGIVTGFGLKPLKDDGLLKSANDIAWELNHKYFPIYNMDMFVKALDKAHKESSPLYHGYYKLVNQIKR